MIVFATLSPDVYFPGSGCLLGEKLGLPGVPALDVRNQCSGFLYGLSVADAWVRAGAYKNVLVVGAEVHSTGLEFSERGRDVAVLFGDGAGAALVGPERRATRGVLSLALHADGSGAKDLWLHAPASSRIAAAHARDARPRRALPQMNGKQVFRWATEKMPEVALEVLRAASIDDRATSISSCLTRRTCASTSSSRRSSASPRTRWSTTSSATATPRPRRSRSALASRIAEGKLSEGDERAAGRVRQRVHVGRRGRQVLRVPSPACSPRRCSMP